MIEFEKVILRFRDLVTECGGTIEQHKRIIAEKGYVWWGWWNKGHEKLPFDEIVVLTGRVQDNPETFYLLDSGQNKLYKALCTDISRGKNGKEGTPETECTPDYYNVQKYFAWFKFSSIEECDIHEIENYTEIEVESLFLDQNINYKMFYGKKIYNTKELIQQNRTLWFVRKYDANKDADYEIRLLNAHILEPTDFSKRFFETEGNTLLWLSDLHLGTGSEFSIQMRNATDVTLAEHIRRVLSNSGEEKSIGGLLISGDITNCGMSEGFDQASLLIYDLIQKFDNRVKSENITFCPGNHDFLRKDENIGDNVPEKVSDNSESVKGYREFYNSIHHLYPNDYMACGRKLLMSSGRTVEIAALNSLILQQYKDFEGHGFISEEQLEFVAEQMGWNKNEETGSTRIVMMHHHYLPVCYMEKVDVKKASSVVYDANRLMKWMAKYDVKLLLHGHKHQSFISKVTCYDDTDTSDIIKTGKDVYVIGMGGTGASGCVNKIAALKFLRDNIELKFYRLNKDNSEQDKCEQSISIPI